MTNAPVLQYDKEYCIMYMKAFVPPYYIGIGSEKFETISVMLYFKLYVEIWNNAKQSPDTVALKFGKIFLGKLTDNFPSFGISRWGECAG